MNKFPSPALNARDVAAGRANIGGHHKVTPHPIRRNVATVTEFGNAVTLVNRGPPDHRLSGPAPHPYCPAADIAADVLLAAIFFFTGAGLAWIA